MKFNALQVIFISRVVSIADRINETVFLLGFVYLFFGFNPLIGVAAVIIVYLLEILIDNTNARVKWQLVVKSSWLIAAVVSVVNLAALYYLSGGLP